MFPRLSWHLVSPEALIDPGVSFAHVDTQASVECTAVVGVVG